MNTKGAALLAQLFALTGPIALPAPSKPLPEWKEKDRAKRVIPTVAPKDIKAEHPGAIHGGEINHCAKMAKGGRAQLPQVRGGYGELRYQTQHERVVAGRRARNPKYLA